MNNETVSETIRDRSDSEHEMVAVEDLQVGDRVDLERDPFADASGETSALLREAYQEVLEVEQETSDCVRVGFEFDAVGFPLGHKVRRQRRETIALEMLGLRVSLIEDDDGYPVICIDSSNQALEQGDDGAPQLRIYINDSLAVNDTPKYGGRTGQR